MEMPAITFGWHVFSFSYHNAGRFILSDSLLECRPHKISSAMQSFTIQPLLVDPFLQRDLLDFGGAASQHAVGDAKVGISCVGGYSEYHTC